MTAINSSTGDQTTQYVYGTTLADSDIASSLLKAAEIYPDSEDGDDQVRFAYNRQVQVKQTTDQNGTVHQFEFDKLGRQIHDRVTTVGTGVDDAVLRLSTEYEVRGMKSKLTSWNNASVTSGDVVNECQFEYNDFGQLVTEYQEHGGEVNTSTTPKVQYGYADGSANTIRPTSLTYPNGRVIAYTYGASGSIPDAISRVDAIEDDDDTALAQYSYLGGSVPAPSLMGNGQTDARFVITDYTEPQIKLTMVNLSGSNDPDTGDIYSGFDRFGRVKDNRWYNYNTSSDVDRIKYGYDRNGNRTYRENTVAASYGKHFDEKYLNDLIDRLSHMDRGDLTALHDAITNKTFAQCWTLDATGNWKGFRQDDTGDGTWDLNQSRASNPVNEITGITEFAGPSWVTPAYDAAGNMTTMPKVANATVSQTCAYDAWNRLISVAEEPTTVSGYVYDAAKRRIIQQSYTFGVLTESRHLYNTEPSKWQVIEERLGTTPDSADAQCQFVWGLRYVDDLMLRDRDTDSEGTLDEQLYCLQDANWNATTLADSGGAAVERFSYSPYSMPAYLTAAFGYRAQSSYNWETLYSGYHFEIGTGLYHVRNRVFDSCLGTWLQRDPLGQSAGMNLHEYIQSRPMLLTDPTGLIPPQVLAAIGGCIAGAIGGAIGPILEALATALSPWEKPGCFSTTYTACNIGCNAITGCLGGALTGFIVSSNPALAGSAGCLGGFVSSALSALCTAYFGCSPLTVCDAGIIAGSTIAGCWSGPSGLTEHSVGNSVLELIWDSLKEVVGYVASSSGLFSGVLNANIGLSTTVCEGVADVFT